MMPTRHSRASRLAAAAACFAALLLAGCERGSAPRVARQASVAQCTGTDAHTTHLKKFACEMCHPTGGTFAFSGTLPGGLAVTGTITRADGLPPSCAVSCHAPDGGTPQPVSWDAGPMTCASCHSGKALVAGGSAHVASTERASCEGCHDLAQHAGGVVQLVRGMQPGTEEMCLSCHSATGGTLANAPGPLLVGWQDPAGDWHGARAGTGAGGTLLPPYARGEAPLPCTACHDEHASTNAFLFAGTVNGRVVPPDTITRAGVGAEMLCEACHEGARHGSCVGCHVTDPQPPGSACFSCHGHEGIRIFVAPSGTPGNYHDGQSGNCDHCHGRWMVTADSIPPTLAYGGQILVTDTTTSSVKISWDTDEPSTSYVEYGTAGLGLVAGSQLLTGHHEVVLSGLAQNTAYQFLVLSSDASRNVTRSSVLSFATTCATCLAAPTPTPISPVWTWDDAFTVALRWSAVTPSDGHPAEYRVVLAYDATFASPAVDSGWIPALSHGVSLPTAHTYYWRVKARDAVHLTESEWSATSSFWSAYNELPE